MNHIQLWGFTHTKFKNEFHMKLPIILLARMYAAIQ